LLILGPFCPGVSKASNHFSFGGGINRFSLDLQLVDNGRQWDWSSVHAGAHLYVGFTF
jgi:hypothetical protein